MSPSSTESPTATSTLQTVPVMWASTSGTLDLLLVGFAMAAPVGPDCRADTEREAGRWARPAGDT